MNYISQPNILNISESVCVCCVFIVQLMESSNAVRKLNSQVMELGSGLEKVKELLEQRNPTVNAAQSVLKVCGGLCWHVCKCHINLLISNTVKLVHTVH